jgi:hypothetical protein
MFVGPKLYVFHGPKSWIGLYSSGSSASEGFGAAAAGFFIAHLPRPFEAGFFKTLDLAGGCDASIEFGAALFCDACCCDALSTWDDALLEAT